MMRIEFFIVAGRNGYSLTDANGAKHCDDLFASKEDAADMAVRFAQDQGVLYAIYY